MEKGKVVRSRVAEVPVKGRTTMGVVFAKPDKHDRILLVATTAESAVDDEEDDGIGPEDDAVPGDVPEIDATSVVDEADEQADDLGSDESDDTTPEE
jgi:DNA gyrase subunit A